MKAYKPNPAARPLLFFILASVAILASCSRGETDFGKLRAEMVRTQILQQGITDKRVLDAMGLVPREEFVLPKYKPHAYDDNEAPLGFRQTLNRPYEDALILSTLELKPTDRVLEVGTGSGYLSALMSSLVKEVYTIEIEPQIAELARKNFEKLGFKNVFALTGDGFAGWPSRAPFDAIILTCSPDKVPEPLKEQLAEGGRLLLPLGGQKKFQELVLYTKKNGTFMEERRIAPAVFVPMKGKVLEKQLPNSFN